VGKKNLGKSGKEIPISSREIGISLPEIGISLKEIGISLFDLPNFLRDSCRAEAIQGRSICLEVKR